MTKEEQVLSILDWVREWQDDVAVRELDEGREYEVSLIDNGRKLSFNVKRKWEFLWHSYSIPFINDIFSHYHYQGCQKLVKRLFNTVKELYIKKQSENAIMDKFEEQVWKMIEFEKTEDFEFGEPMHPENLPNFPLEVGKTYFVPLKLIGKERRFDGGRGTEYYEFNYQTETYGYRPFSIPDYDMTPFIQCFYDGENLIKHHKDTKPVSNKD